MKTLLCLPSVRTAGPQDHAWRWVHGICLAALLGSALAASGATLTVTSTADTGAGSLRATIAAASPGDTINFNAALNGQAIRLTNGALFISRNLTILGPGPGSLAIRGNLTNRVFRIAEGVSCLMAGLSITNGHATDPADSSTPIEGGAIVTGGTLTLTNCVLSGNVAAWGGAIYNYGSLNLHNVTFHRNAATILGGAIFNEDGTNCVVLARSIAVLTNTAAVSGGAFCSYGGLFTLLDSSVQGNEAAEEGGAMLNLGTFTNLNTLFLGNRAGTDGGGIANQGAATLDQCVLGGNWARDGGGIYLRDGSLAVIRSVLTGNGATNSGGGLACFKGASLEFSTVSSNSATLGAGLFNNVTTNTVTVRNSTLAFNRATNGAGCYHVNGTLNLVNSTLGGNDATNGGGGLFVNNGAASLIQCTVSGNSANNGGGVFNLASLALRNTIVAGNQVRTAGPDIRSASDFPVSNGRNFIGQTVGITNSAALTDKTFFNTGLDRLGQLLQADGVGAPVLADNGGPTWTIALVPGSPAINAGLNTDASATEDQRGAGFPRIVGSLVDIGAFEDGSSFETTPIPGVPGVVDSSVSWADFNNDGRLDFIVTGSTNRVSLGGIAQLWQNTPAGFSNVTGVLAPGLPQVYAGSTAWADFNNDGRVDLFICGKRTNGDYVSQLWENRPAGFSNVTSQVVPGLPGLTDSAVAWADYDRDGRQDLLLTGTTNGLPSGGDVQLWKNTATGFTNVIGAFLRSPGRISKGTVAWADYDKDGRPDFLVSGQRSNLTFSATLYRNTSSGFVPILSLSNLANVASGTVAWGDYDNDGWLDFLITGQTNFVTGQGASQLWRNTGSGFSNVTSQVASGLPGLGFSSAAWGDFDNDGRLDFMITGRTNLTLGQQFSQLWRNTPTGFSNVTALLAPTLAGHSSGGLAWADYDNDGRLDFVVAGMTNFASGGRLSVELWRNKASLSNSPPSAPCLVNLETNGSNLTVTWSPAADAETPAGGLTYNIILGTNLGAGDLASPLANPSTGFRRVVRLGAVSGGTNDTFSYKFLQLPGAARYWCSVQAVDSSLAGGPFAPAMALPPTQIAVTNKFDGPVGSLRWAIASSSDGGTVTLDYNLLNTQPGGSRILLTNGELVIDKALTVIGTGVSPVVLTGSGTHRHFYLQGTCNPPVMLAGLTLAEGRGGGARLGGHGGAILNQGAALVLSNCTLNANTAQFEGGALFNTIAGVCIAKSCILSSNQANLTGGSIANYGQVTLEDGTVRASSGKYGGGICNGPGADLIVAYTTFHGNQAELYGGGVFNLGTMVLSGGTLSSNFAFAGGGVFGGDLSSTVLANSTLCGNTATNNGGGLLNNGTLELSGSTVSGNAADGGGGVFNFETLTLNNSIVAGNSASTAGTDIRSPQMTPFSNGRNFIGTKAGIVNNVALTDLTFTDTGTTLGALLATNALGQPLLASNGGPTRTIALVAGSPAIDAGLNSDAAGYSFDQRGAGFPRIAGSAVDIGAYENSANAIVLACPANLTLTNTLNRCYATNVPFVVTATGTPTPAVVCRLTNTVITSPHSFFVGTSLVLCTATNLVATNVCSFAVTVNDVQVPGIQCPGNLLTNAPLGSNSALVVFSYQAGDNCAVASAGCTPPSGSYFPIGVTAVLCRALDAAGNSNSCTFSVTVNGAACPGTIMVLNTNSTGPGSLRQALADVCPDGTIVFTNSLQGRTIVLTNGELVLNKGVSILGPGADQLAISGNGGSRVFFVQPGMSVLLAGLTLTGGNGAGSAPSGYGGSLYNQGTLVVSNCALHGNSALDGGGLKNVGGSVLLTASTVSSNTASFGGGLYSYAGPLTVLNSTLSGNTAHIQGGGVFVSSHTLTLRHCTVTGNRAATGGGGGGLFDGGTEHLAHSIVAGNVAGSLPGDLGGNGVDSATYTLIGDEAAGNPVVQAGPGNLVLSNTIPITDILDTNLVFHGGPTRTHLLTPGSPAYNSGDPSFDDSDLPYDQRGAGFPRVSGEGLDLGAVELTSSLTTLASAPNPSLRGQPVVFTATVTTDPPGGTLATGSVQFFDGASSLGMVALDGAGQARLTNATLTAAGHSITARYLGSSAVPGSVSPPVSQLVTKAGTTATLATSVNPSVAGQSVTLTATVTAVAPGGGTPGGNVQFFDGVTLLGTAGLNGNGRANLTRSTLAVGTHSLSARYVGSVNYLTSTSAPSTQVVSAAATMTALEASPTPAPNSEPVTLTAAVTAVAPGSGVPGGTVEFFDGTNRLGVVALEEDGLASLTLAPLSLGSHSLMASYSGEGSFLASSGALVLPVCAPAIVVLNTNNSGPGSLRQALLDVCPDGIITFAPVLHGTTILLTSGQLVLPTNVAILGPGADLLTISANNNSRLLRIDAGATTWLEGITFTRGRVTGGPQTGGAIQHDGASLTVNRCAFRTNSATRDGGAIFNNGGELLLVDSLLAGNTATRTAGGLFNAGGVVELVNCTLSTNSAATFGGALHNTNGTLTVRHCTFSGNVATNAAALYSGSGATMTVSHSLFARGANGVNVMNDGATGGNAGFNLSDDASAGTLAMQVTDLLLGPLSTNGGPTLTHRLQLGSPAIDAGTNAAIPGLPYDQRGPGFFRQANTRVDIGAYEVQPPEPSQVAVTPAGVCVSLKGEPNETLVVEWNDNPAESDWQVLDTRTTDASGHVEVIDATPLNQRRFYRTKRP